MSSRTSTTSLLGNALLALIQQRPSSGYDLRRLFAESHLHHFSSSPGAIYPALARLEKGGLIIGRTEQGNTLRPRRVYHITDQGSKVLRQWLERPVTRENVESNLKELTLRFAFMGGVLDDEETIRFLDGVIAELGPFINDLDSYIRTGTEDLSMHGRLAVESGLAHYRSFLEWAHLARRRFRDPGSDTSKRTEGSSGEDSIIFQNRPLRP
jgi:PadR family transcriptional regulator AphA